MLGNCRGCLVALDGTLNLAHVELVGTPWRSADRASLLVGAADLVHVELHRWLLVIGWHVQVVEAIKVFYLTGLNTGKFSPEINLAQLITRSRYHGFLVDEGDRCAHLYRAVQSVITISFGSS